MYHQTALQIGKETMSPDHSQFTISFAIYRKLILNLVQIIEDDEAGSGYSF